MEGIKATPTPKYNNIYLTIKQAREKKKAVAAKAAAAELSRQKRRVERGS